MEQYTHLLIPVSRSLVASPNQIADFLEKVVELGIVGERPTIAAWTIKRIAQQVRYGRNPVTGEVIELPMPTRQPDKKLHLCSMADLPQQTLMIEEYDVAVGGIALPKVEPLPIDPGEAYHLRISCHARSCLVSLSSDYAGAMSAPQRPRFNEDCTEAASLGLFAHPVTSELIEVPNAGCARFWVEFELDKWLCPRIVDRDLEILNPQLVQLAKQCFQTHFVQGCSWTLD